ncbi:MAG TPA: transposase [Gammaproteobacteria bacterium]|nr:transposase [Gammaproteobacteria bacterium]
MTEAQKGSRHLRQGRHSQTGQIYLLTTCTHNRQKLFTLKPIARLVINSLHWLEQQGRMGLLAAVVMPDHLHFVAQLHTGTLNQLMQSLKGYTGREINQLLGKNGPIWQRQYHDHALRTDEDLNQVILYCLQNPQRAGLVDDFHYYPHWYCRYEV